MSRYRYVLPFILALILRICTAHALPLSYRINENEIASNTVFIEAASIAHTSAKNHAANLTLTVKNTGQIQHTIIAALSPAAVQAKLLTTHGGNHNHVVQASSIIIKQNTTKKLSSNSAYIILIGLKKQLSIGDQIPLALVFKDGSWSTLLVSVI